MTKPFSITDDGLLPHGTLIEASAGTGKTHAVAQYVTKAIATDESLRIGEILVTTFTRNAAAELKERIRSRLIITALLLKGQPAPAGYTPDDLDAHLISNLPHRDDMARRLDRAAAEFETSVIGTIHAICSHLLRIAGVEVGEPGDEKRCARVVEEVVNDAVVTEALEGRQWNEKELCKLVKHRMADPLLSIASDPQMGTEDQQSLCTHLRSLIEECAQKARGALRMKPGFDELLVQTWERVTDRPDDLDGDRRQKAGLQRVLRERFKLAIVDEAQDTNRLQWQLFHTLFPPGGKSQLIGVGDPKQAIYGFRGADVTAYVQHAQDGVPPENGSVPRRTLSVNRRSDGPLLDGLNHAMQDTTFGAGISYQRVTPAPDRSATQLAGLKPVEFLDAGPYSLAEAAVRKVAEALTRPVFRPEEPRPFKPQEVCVLVRANATGSAIARSLQELKIPAVTEGAASVMNGQMAADLQCLLEAMEKPSDIGRARRAAATAFFGKKLTEVADLEEIELQRLQATIMAMHATLQRQGLAAVAAKIMADHQIVKRFTADNGGDRRLVDFSHVVELLNDASEGRGCHARHMLEHFNSLAAQDVTSELVSRRVESDAEAVTVMTVHAAKGLQFPCVIVVHGWHQPPFISRPEIFHNGGERWLDIGKAFPNGSISTDARNAARQADAEELRRLIYVAVTRPQHHLSILRTAEWQESLLADVLRQSPASSDDIPAEMVETFAVRSAEDLPSPGHWTACTAETAIGVAPLPPGVEPITCRTSFSGILRRAGRLEVRGDEPAGHGHDEAAISQQHGDEDPGSPPPTSAETAASGPKPDLSGFAIASLPAGVAFGTIAHDCLEMIEAGPDISEADLRSQVREVVDTVATARFLNNSREDFAAMLSDALLTPFGGPPEAPYSDLRFADFGRADRLVEMDFEMGMASLDVGVEARHVGRLLEQMTSDVPADAWLARYAADLAGPQFAVPLGGLINGAIDAVFRLPGSTSEAPRLLIADYKTNRLHDRDDAEPLACYSRSHLSQAMAGHHYLLQALVYGTAVWRMLRWRLGPQKPAGWDPAECIAGVVYGFIRGMRGPATPLDGPHARYGVFTWQPPPEIWRRLSDLLAGDLSGVSS